MNTDLQTWTGAATAIPFTTAAAYQGTTPLNCSSNNPVAGTTCQG
jgi:hypothetical protein